MGQFVEPTVLLDQTGESQVYTDEIFGPVAVVRTFETEEQGVRMANQTSYGLNCESSPILLFELVGMMSAC